MAEQTASKVPQIRFKGFAGEWEEKELGELADIKLGKMLDKIKHTSGQLLPYLNNISLRWNDVDTSNLPQMYFKDDELERFGLQAGDVVVCEGGEPGRSAIWDGHLPNLKFQKAIHRVRFNVPYEAPLLVLHLQNIVGTNRFEMLFTGGGIKHLTRETFSLLKVPQPSLQEQRDVANFLSELDSLIGLHQRKHDKLVTLKKAMLQKMFPHPGATTPEIRFKGFSGDWEEKKLGELCQEFHSGKFISASEIAGTGQYRVYGGNGLRGFSAKYNHDGLYALIGRQGALCGNMNLFSGRAFFTEHAIAVQADKDNDTVFLFYLFGKMDLGQYSSQSAQPGLAVNKLQKLSSLICKKSEQIQIGTYFRTLDSLISQHATQLQKLQQLKSACLARMFV